MRTVETWGDLQRSTDLTEICDGHVGIDPEDLPWGTDADQREQESLKLPDNNENAVSQWLRDLDEQLPASVASHVVLVAKGETERTVDTLDQLLPRISEPRKVRILARPELAKAAPTNWPIAGLIIDNADTMEKVLEQASANRSRLIYIDPFLLSEQLLAVIREVVLTHPHTTFVFASLADRFWRFASLLARQADNVMLDTSELSTRRLRALFANRYQFARLINDLHERIIFAAGSPCVRPLNLLQALIPWFTTDQALKSVLRDNALRLYFTPNSE